jgi:uncharacterized membrane protein
VTGKIINRLIMIMITAVLMILTLFEWEYGVIRLLFGISLTVILPGYALTTAIFLNYPIGFIEKLGFSLGFSLGLASLGGILLHFTPWGVQPVTLVALLGGVAIFFSLVALGRIALGRAVDVSVVQMPLHLSQLFLLLFAGLIIGGAYLVARDGALNRPVVPYTQLWLLWEDEAHTAVRVGLHNWEQVTTTYHLELRNDHGRVYQFPPITLEPRQTWEVIYNPPPIASDNDQLRAVLYRADDLQNSYREVYLRRPLPAIQTEPSP